MAGLTSRAIYYAGVALLLSSVGCFLFDEWYPNWTPDFVHRVKERYHVASTNRRIERLWKGPFEHEAMIYVSTETFNSTGSNITQFFDMAHFLWHINPQTATGKPQLFSFNVSMPVTPEFKRTGQIYCYAFLQKPSKLLGKQHPDVLDPEIKYHSNVLMRYPVSGGGSQILGPPDVAYELELTKMSDSPKAEDKATSSRLDAPPLPSRNMFKTKEETVIAEETTLVPNDGAEEVVNVEFEVEASPGTMTFSGDSIVYVLELLMTHTIKTMVRDITLVDPKDPTKALTHQYKPMIKRFVKKSEGREPSGFIGRMMSVLYFVIIASLVLAFVKINSEF